MTQTKVELDEFERLLDESFATKLNVADVVKGVIVKKENDGYLVDVGAKSEGFLPNREIPSQNIENPLSIGDQKEFYVLREDDNDENGVLLS